MASRKEQKEELRRERHRREEEARAAARRRTLGLRAVAVVAGAVVALGAVFVLSSTGGGGSGSGAKSGAGGEFKFAVGDPGPGLKAPPIGLQATDGTGFDLASLQGRTVLLYFQEGIMCQPCWDQLKDIESEFSRFRALGIDEIVTITSDPLDQLSRKVADEGLKTPVLSDPDLRVSKTYDTNSYGMMGDSRNGHTFMVVDEKGRIAWRADYGGAPDFTMYLPVKNLLADMRKGLAEERT